MLVLKMRSTFQWHFMVKTRSIAYCQWCPNVWSTHIGHFETKQLSVGQHDKFTWLTWIRCEIFQPRVKIQIVWIYIKMVVWPVKIHWTMVNVMITNEHSISHLTSSYVSPRRGLKGLPVLSHWDATADTANAATHWIENTWIHLLWRH